ADDGAGQERHQHGHRHQPYDHGRRPVHPDVEQPPQDIFGDRDEDDGQQSGRGQGPHHVHPAAPPTPTAPRKKYSATGMKTMDSRAAAARSPITYDPWPPALSSFLGRIGGTGASDRATSAVLTAGWRLKASDSPTATSGMPTAIASSVRDKRPGRETRYSRSARVARSPRLKTMRKMLVRSASMTSIAAVIVVIPPFYFTEWAAPPRRGTSPGHVRWACGHSPWVPLLLDFFVVPRLPALGDGRPGRAVQAQDREMALLSGRRLGSQVQLGRAVGLLRRLVARAERGERLVIGEPRLVLGLVECHRPEVGGRNVGRQLEAIARAARQGHTGAFGEGDHVLRALARDLGDHSGAGRRG